MYSITRRLATLVATLVVVFAVTSCAESSRPSATGKGNIRGINAIATSPDVAFLIEERRLSSLNFKDSDSYSPFDDLSYKFNFDAFRSGDIEPSRLSSQFIDVQANHEYTVVLTGSIANPSSLYWEDPIREWDDADTVSELVFAHFAGSKGTFDIYFAAPGTMPVMGQAVGTVGYRERLPGIDFEADVFELVLTRRNDPGTIIYHSFPVTLRAQTRVLFAIFEPDPTLPGNVAVSFIDDGGQSTSLPDVRFPPQLRMLHAASGTDNFDGYFESEFTEKIYSDVGFGDYSPYADVFESLPLLTLTQVGNSGAPIHEDELIVPPNTKRTVALVGEPGDLSFHILEDTTRPIETFAAVRFFNAAFNPDALDIYILEPGTPIDDDINPRIQGIPPNVDTQFIDFQEQLREVTITLTGEKTPIAAPVMLDLDNGDVVDVTIIDTVDPNVVEVIMIEVYSLP